MADIQDKLDTIRAAVNGEEVRGTIADALEAMNTQAAAAQEWATGEDDPTAEPGPENSSKYYAEQAAASAATLTLDPTLTSATQAAQAAAVGHRTRDLTDCNRRGLISYAAGGSYTGAGFTITQDGNKITLNGTSSATAAQQATKMSITDHLQTWNASTVPEAVKIYPIPMYAGHTYRLYAKIISGTRDAGDGPGNITVGIIDSDETRTAASILISQTEISAEYISNGLPVRLDLRSARLMTVTDLVIEITLEDITTETLLAEIETELDTKQSALTFDSVPTVDSINPVTSNGVYSANAETREAIGYHDGPALEKTSQSGYYWNSQTSAAILTSITSWTADTINVSAGDVVHVHTRGETSTKQWPVLAVDDSYNIIEHYGSRTQTVQDINIAVPNGATKLLLSHYSTVSSSVAVYPRILNSVPEMIESVDASADYAGCKLSLLGDSFSAFEGYSTDGHNYYPSSASDVADVNQMWWKIVADHFGMTPLVIGGWSGSTVAAGVRSASTYTPASAAERCEALHSGSDNPDVILVAMGVNDYTYTENAAQFGNWDGSTALGSETDLSDYENTTFKTAYATMLARMQRKYPNAFIICVTPWFQKRRTTDTGANYLNAIGKSIDDYADAVREVCGIMHVTCINGTNIGFNRYNYYPAYCQDVAVQSTHPNTAGQAQIAKAIIAKMKTIHRMGA